MGQEAESEVRRAVFASYQVNHALMGLAKPGALFMHCLPAHRGEEVTPDVFESRVSIVFDQAENRLHGQKALLMMLMAPSAGLSLG
jgi:ornithine carbamoyltransferase